MGRLAIVDGRSGSVDLVVARAAAEAGVAEANGERKKGARPAGAGTDSDIFVAHSTDRGQTWSPRVRVNDDPTGLVNDQFGQWLSADPADGSVSLSWDDTRNDPAHMSTDIFYARNTDGGLSFSPNVRVTTAPTNEACATRGVRFYGDYQGIAAFGGIVHPVWTDRRASVSALGEEVFAATITV